MSTYLAFGRMGGLVMGEKKKWNKDNIVFNQKVKYDIVI